MLLGSRDQSGFTLIEIVIVIALSALFLVLAFKNTTVTQSTQQFVTSVEKMKSILHNAQNEGQAGVSSNSSGSGFLCGTKLAITGDGRYQEWRIYGSNDFGSGGTLTYDSVTGGAFQALAPYALTIQSIIQSNTPNKNPDSSFQGGTVRSEIDFIFLSPNSQEPIGQSYVYADNNLSKEPTGNCSDFGNQAATTPMLLTNIFFNVYSSSDTTKAHLATVDFITGTGSILNQVQQ